MRCANFNLIVNNQMVAKNLSIGENSAMPTRVEIAIISSFGCRKSLSENRIQLLSENI